MSAAERYKNANTQDQRGMVSGQLAEMACSHLVHGVGEAVTLTPISAAGDRALSTKTDGEGRFTFRDLPGGLYEVKTQVRWTTSYNETYDDGTTDLLYTDHTKLLIARVQVRPGQKARTISFNEGAVRDGFYSYGGILSKPHHPLVKCN
jgi:hypothetical protein